MNEKQKEMTAAEMAKGDVAANDDHGLKYPANKVQEGLRRLIAEDKIDDEGADLIFWLYSYIQENNLSYNGAAEMTGMSSTVIYHLVHADYKAKYDSVLEKIENWTEAEIHDTVMAEIPETGMKNGQMLWPLRIAISGKESTPGGAFEIAYLLGKEETLKRLHQAMEKLAE